jgi:hypothetical protein
MFDALLYPRKRTYEKGPAGNAGTYCAFAPGTIFRDNSLQNAPTATMHITKNAVDQTMSDTTTLPPLSWSRPELDAEVLSYCAKVLFGYNSKVLK